MCWKDEVGIIHTHDSIPYKLLDKGFRFFFIHLLPTPFSLLSSLKLALILIPHFTTRDIFVRVCAHLAPLPPLASHFLSRPPLLTV